MNNEIVVTRAPRLKSFRQSAIRPGTYFLQATYNPMNQYGLFEMGHHGVSRVNGPFELPYDIELRDIHVVPFESFEAMCKWVARGRKLEDLQGDCKDEWIPALDMYCGTYGEVVEPYGDCALGEVVFRRNNDDHYPIMKVSDSLGCAGRTLGDESRLMVWPIGPGDSITITVKP